LLFCTPFTGPFRSTGLVAGRFDERFTFWRSLPDSGTAVAGREYAGSGVGALGELMAEKVWREQSTDTHRTGLWFLPALAVLPEP